MLKVDGAKLRERTLMQRVERAVMRELGQDNFFETYITIVGAEQIREVNASTRNVDSVTDVLSFPYFEGLEPPVSKDFFKPADFEGRRVMLGYILICRERAEEQANEFGHTYARELAFLTCHGLLHLMGFDHIAPADEEIMTARQRAVMRAVGLAREGER